MAVSQCGIAGKRLRRILLSIYLLAGLFWITGEIQAQATVKYKEDINGDGSVNSTDVIALLTLGRQYPDSTAADFNGDGKWTITDAVKLLVNIVGDHLTPLEPPPPPPPANVTWTVTMSNFKFVPSTLTIAVGDTVKWVAESAGHTTTSGTNGVKDGKWDSGTVATGNTYSFVFTQAGTYPYYCTPHWALGMTGTITVK